MNKPQIKRIKAKNLNVDPTVQRGLHPGKMAKIRDGWDDNLVGVLIVSQRGDGTYWIIEGQHRWAAAMDHPELGEGYEFLCEVHVGLTLAEEARMFRGINTLRTLPHAYDRYRVSLVAEDETALEVGEALAAVGLKPGMSAAADTVGAIQALTRVVERWGGETLALSLEVLIQAFGRKPDTYDADLLQAVAALVGENPKVDQKRLVAKLSGKGRKVFEPGDWKRAAVSVGKMGGSTSRSQVLRRHISEAYNNGLSEAKWIK